MKKICFFFIACGAFFVAQNAHAAVTHFISDEVSGTGQSARESAETLDDAWRTSVTSANLCNTDFTVGSVDDAQFPIILDNSTGLTASVQLLDMDGGAMLGGTLATSQGGTASSTSTTMQDGAPKPQALYTAGEAYYNENAGATTNVNGALFTFSEPLTAFGAFFGDVETRTDGGGTPAILRLFDSAGAQVGADKVIEPVPSDPSFDQSQCGDPGNGTFRGCGNRTTRWIGFSADVDTTVAHMLVIVGDDDTSAGTDNGNTEHISFIGATSCAPTQQSTEDNAEEGASSSTNDKSDIQAQTASNDDDDNDSDDDDGKNKNDECSGSIGNTIWLDNNGNGRQDENEKGIENIRVKLVDDDDNEYRTDTNHNGHYRFKGVDKGRYKIKVKKEDVQNYTLTYDPTGQKNHKASVHLDCDDDHTKADFGYRLTSSIEECPL